MVAAAQSHILKRGLQTLTIRELATANGLSEAALYRHFRSKREILMAVASDIETKLMRAIKEASRGRNDPMDRLRGIMGAHLSFTERRMGGLFVLVSEAINQRDPILRRQLRRIVARYLGQITAELKQARAMGAIRRDLDLTDASQIFFGLIQTTAMNYVLSGYREPPAKAFGSLWGIYARGICRSGEDGAGR